MMHLATHVLKLSHDQEELTSGWELAGDQIVENRGGGIYWYLYALVFNPPSSFFDTLDYYPKIFLSEQET